MRLRPAKVRGCGIFKRRPAGAPQQVISAAIFAASIQPHPSFVHGVPTARHVLSPAALAPGMRHRPAKVRKCGIFTRRQASPPPLACLGSDGSLAVVLSEATCTEEMPTESQTCPAAAAFGSATVKIVPTATYDGIGMDSLAEPAAGAQFEGGFKVAMVAALPSLALT
jgi:hypothetical protein